MNLHTAKLCLDCEEIYIFHQDECPACLSKAFIWLVNITKSTLIEGPKIVLKNGKVLQ